MKTAINDKKVVLSVATKNAEMVEYDTKKVLWNYSGDLIWNAHAIELLPNGIIAVAGSTGNNLTFFDSSDKENKNPYNLSFADAHGVIWDSENEILWAIGGNILKGYNATLENGKITVTEVESVTLPATGAHDFQPIYGKPYEYWITTSKNVLIFNSKTRTVSTVPTSLGIGTTTVKGIGSFSDGCVVETIADGSYESWNTKTVHMYRFNSVLNMYITEDFISLSDAAFYKLRVWNSEYH